MWKPHLNGEGLPGFAPRFRYQACQGSTVQMCGMCAASHASATGLLVSGVDVESTRSTLSSLISCLASWPALGGLDWLSLSMIFTAYCLPPMFSPWASFARTSVNAYG